MAPSLWLPFVPFTLYVNLVLEQNRWHEKRKTSRIFLPPPFPGDDGYCCRQPQGSLSDSYNTATVFTRIGYKRWPANALQTISLSSEIQCVGTILSIVWVDTKPLLFPILFFCFRRNSPQWARASSFTRFLDHTQRRTTVGRTRLEDWSSRRRDLYLTILTTEKRPCPRWDSNPQPQQASGRRPTP